MVADLPEDDYGISPWDTLKILQELMPLIAQAHRLVNEPDNYRKGIIVADALEWLASRSKTTCDDELVKLVGDMVKTPEGEKLIRWVLAKAGV